MEYKINKEDYKKMLSKFYFNKFKWYLIFALIATLFGTYCLIVGIVYDDKETIKYAVNGYSFAVIFLLVYVIGIKTSKKQSLNATRFNDNNEIEFRMEREEDSIKLYDLTNDNYSTIKIQDITKVVAFKDKEYSFIVCEYRAFIVKNNEIIDNLKQEIENK
ncbi:MAG: hypothetical protein IJA72_02790 [Clostridia bacterium]|nr:hypothetical protein [Clostridia bacterium]